jgi:hypothetical protein
MLAARPAAAYRQAIPGDRYADAMSSALMKLMSNDALWITSGASPMKARNSPYSVNSGLLARTRVERPWTVRPGRHVRSGSCSGESSPGRYVVEQLT